MRWRDWLGVGERRWKKAPDEEVQPAKTLWDWLQLLIVPAILIGVTFAWSASQTRSNNKRDDRRIAADRAAAEEARQDATLQAYLDQMSGLMLNKKLLASKVDSPVRAVARTVTLTTLRRLDGERKGEVVRFLHEAQLLLRSAESPQVELRSADLRDVELNGAFLNNDQFGKVDLRDAHLTGASLGDSDLLGANLKGGHLANADLDDADLSTANLAGANLTHADLLGADLSDTHLEDANLAHAYLAAANLQDAHLEGADLKGAIFVVADLRRANLAHVDLTGAHLEGAKLGRTENLDLDRLIIGLSPKWQRVFLESQKPFLDSLSRAELAKFNLSPEKLAGFRREASGP